MCPSRKRSQDPPSPEKLPYVWQLLFFANPRNYSRIQSTKRTAVHPCHRLIASACPLRCISQGENAPILKPASTLTIFAFDCFLPPQKQVVELTQQSLASICANPDIIYILTNCSTWLKAAIKYHHCLEVCPLPRSKPERPADAPMASTLLTQTPSKITYLQPSRQAKAVA